MPRDRKVLHWIGAALLTLSGVANAVSPSSLSAGVAEPSPKNMVRLRLSPSAAIVGQGGGFTGWGLGAGLLLQNSLQLETGLETGAFRWTEASGDLVGVPLMYTLAYRLSTYAVQPYLGFSAGVFLMRATKASGVGTSTGGLLSATPGTTTGFIVPLVLARAGVEVALADGLHFFAEAKAGIMLDVLMLSPQVGLSIGL